MSMQTELLALAERYQNRPETAVRALDAAVEMMFLGSNTNTHLPGVDLRIDEIREFARAAGARGDLTRATLDRILEGIERNDHYANMAAKDYHVDLSVRWNGEISLTELFERVDQIVRRNSQDRIPDAVRELVRQYGTRSPSRAGPSRVAPGRIAGAANRNLRGGSGVSAMLQRARQKAYRY